MNTLALILNPLLAALALVVTGLLTPLVGRLTEKLKLDSDDKVRGYLQQALDIGVQSAVERVRAGLLPRALAAEDAAAHPIAFTAGAMARLGLTGDAMRVLAEKRIDAALKTTPAAPAGPAA